MPSESSTRVLLNRRLVFARESEGVTLGFDLDDTTTETGDATGCGHGDFTHSDGSEGIDNQFSQLLPIIEQFGGMALESYASSAINSGSLLIMMEIEVP